MLPKRRRKAQPKRRHAILKAAANGFKIAIPVIVVIVEYALNHL